MPTWTSSCAFHRFRTPSSSCLSRASFERGQQTSWRPFTPAGPCGWAALWAARAVLCQQPALGGAGGRGPGPASPLHLWGLALPWGPSLSRPRPQHLASALRDAQVVSRRVSAPWGGGRRVHVGTRTGPADSCRSGQPRCCGRLLTPRPHVVGSPTPQDAVGGGGTWHRLGNQPGGWPRHGNVGRISTHTDLRSCTWSRNPAAPHAQCWARLFGGSRLPPRRGGPGALPGRHC